MGGMGSLQYLATKQHETTIFSEPLFTHHGGLGDLNDILDLLPLKTN